MKNLIKLDTQNGYHLWQLEVAGKTVYAITLLNEPPPDYGYFDPKQIERFSPVSFEGLY